MKLEINHNSSTPLYLQAESLLRDLIKQEEYKNGKLLPNETDLSKELNISRNTLRQAINKLVYDGLLVRKKGVGTKVQRKGILSGANNWLSFSQEMKAMGIEICNFELFVGYKKPPKEIQTFFEIPEDEKVLALQRLRGKKDFPFVYFLSYFNPKIPLSNEDNFSEPLYDLLEKKYDVVVKTSKEEVSAILADSFLAEKLEVNEKAPILLRKRFVYDINNEPVEYNIGYYRADSFTYTIESSRE